MCTYKICSYIYSGCTQLRNRYVFRGSLAWPGAIGIRTSTCRTGKELFSFLLSLDTFCLFLKTGLSELLFVKWFQKGLAAKSFFPGPCGFKGKGHLKIRPRYPTAPRADCVEASKECEMLKAQAWHNLSGKGCIWKRFLVPAPNKKSPKPHVKLGMFRPIPNVKMPYVTCPVLVCCCDPGSCGASKRHRWRAETPWDAGLLAALYIWNGGFGTERVKKNKEGL